MWFALYRQSPELYDRNIASLKRSGVFTHSHTAVHSPRRERVILKYSRIAAGVITILAGVFFCTIQEDRGNPAAPGPNQPDDPAIVEDPDLTPGLYGAADSAYVGIGDTLAIRIKVMRDSSVSDTAAFSQALITAEARRGWLSADSVFTDVNGRAVIFYADTLEGQREITLYCQGVSQRIRFSVTNTPDQIQKQVIALPSSAIVKADGRSSTLIDVRVINSDHNPLVGEAVQFITTAGVIAGLEPPSQGNAGQSVTNQDGVAQARLTSAAINDTAYVTVFLVADRSKSDETQVTFQGVTIQLDCDSTNLRTDQQTRVLATVLNGANEPIAKTPIFFSLGGDSLSCMNILSADSVSGFDGNAAVVLAGVRAGSDSLIAIAAGARSFINLNVTDLSLAIDLQAQTLQARDDISTELDVHFTDKSGNSLEEKTVRVVRMYPNRQGAAIADTLVGKTGGDGHARFTITGIPYEAVMRLKVTAFNTATDKASAEAALSFLTTRQMTIYATPTIIQADGTARSRITVLVKNELNNPLQGDTILFSSDAGVISPLGVTDESGKTVVDLISDRRNTIATVTASLAKDRSKTVTVPVEFAGVEISANAVPRSINANDQDTSVIHVTLLDASKNPITGERVNFYRLQDKTRIVQADSATDNRGEARCKVVGAGEGIDSITAVAAGARAQTVIYYSSNYLSISPDPDQSLIANGADSTVVRIRYLEGDRKTPITNTPVAVSVTIGNLGEVFATEVSTDGNGRASFTMRNPDFANTATIAATATTESEITVAEKKLYFKANDIARIKLSGSPEVISTNGDRASITAVAFDSLGNRVKDAHLSFNILNGPGGGEYLDPPTAITREDGSAGTFLISGTIPSTFRQVKVVAGDFSAIKSDTIHFTIAGPPHAITIRRDIGEIIEYDDGTYGKKCAAIVTDVNGNPVADGTEVTFSLKITAYRYFFLCPKFYIVDHTAPVKYSYSVDTCIAELPFEDLNDNFRLDPGEDRDPRDGIASRGEDLNGNGKAEFGPGFIDINWNGVRDRNPEPVHRFISYYDQNGEPVWDSVFADYNGNNVLDFIEPLTDSGYIQLYNRVKHGAPALDSRPSLAPAPSVDSVEAYHSWRQDSVAWASAYAVWKLDSIQWRSDLQSYQEDKSRMAELDAWYYELSSQVDGGFEIDWNQNGAADPVTTATISRTVQTQRGKAANEVVYGQSDALRIRVMISAESQGVVTKSPEEFILPISEEDYPYWSVR